MHALRPALPLLFPLLLAACAPAARYQIAQRYEPPDDAAGLACVAQCTADLQSCRGQCAQAHAQCVRALEPEARAMHADALKRYEGELLQYRRDLDRYHLNLSLGWGHYDDGWYGGGWYDPWWPHGYRPHAYPPTSPQPPRYEDTLERLRKARCNDDCRCQPAYDACFLDCGGRRVPERRCIANCPSDR